MYIFCTYKICIGFLQSQEVTFTKWRAGTSRRHGFLRSREIPYTKWRAGDVAPTRVYL